MDAAAIVEEIEARIARMAVRNTPALRILRREYSRRLRHAPPQDAVKIAAALIAAAVRRGFLAMS